MNAQHHLFSPEHELLEVADLGTAAWARSFPRPMCHCYLSVHNLFYVWKHNSDHELVWQQIDRKDVPGALLASMTLQGIQYE